VADLGGAATRIDFNVELFNAAMEEYIKTFRKNVEFEIQNLALELLTKIERRTPTKTHRLQNSFHVIMPGETDSYRFEDSEGRSFDGVLHDHPHAELSDDVIEAIVGSSGTAVPYNIRIEAGGSKQAPQGMVAISVAEMMGKLEAAVTKELEKGFK
jgi:hypothetical protein